MADYKHLVEEGNGYSIHREVPAKRTSDDFDLTQISSETRLACRRVMIDGGATPADYRHVFESLLGREMVNEILK